MQVATEEDVIFLRRCRRRGLLLTEIVEMKELSKTDREEETRREKVDDWNTK